MSDLIDKIANAFSKNKRFFTLTIIAYIVICIIIILIIWWPKESNLHAYTSVDVSVRQQTEAQRYINLVSNILRKEDKETFKNLISSKYIKYIGKSDDDIIKMLEDEGYFSDTTEVRGMQLYVDNNTYIYSTTVYSSKGNNRKLNIIETYPYKYTISLDDFYSYNEVDKISIIKNIKFTITEIYYNLKYVEYNIKIENLNNFDVKFNFNDSTQLQAITSAGKAYNVANFVSTSNYTTVNSNSVINKKIVFEIPVQLQESIKYIRFKGVTFEYSSSNIDIEL